MSTDEQNLTLRRPPLAAPATPENHSASQRDERELPTIEESRQRSQPAEQRDLAITVLTTDAELADSIKSAVAGFHSVYAAANVEEAAALATTGRCPILVTDQALTQQALAAITAPLRAHEPALVTIAVGNRGNDNALIALLSAGVADRLMLKPVTAALARIVIESAVREHRTQRAKTRTGGTPTMLRSTPSPTLVDEIAPPTALDGAQATRSAHQFEAEPAEAIVTPESSATSGPTRMPQLLWVALAAALAAVAFAVWWMMSTQPPQIDTRAAIDANLSDARLAYAEGRYIDPSQRSALHYYNTVLSLDSTNTEARSGIDRIADRYLEDAEALLRTGRLAEAGLALDRARHVRPDHARLPLLDKELRTGINGILAQARESEVRIEAVPSINKPVPTTPAKAASRKPVAERAAQAANTDSTVVTLGTRDELSPIAPLATSMPATQTVALNRPNAPRVLIDEAQDALSLPLPERTQAMPQVPAVDASVQQPTAIEPARPKLLKFVQPEYPSEAAMRGFEGWVDVGLDVTAAGDVVNPRIEDSSSGRLFHRAALAAVRKWKYEPRPASAPTERIQVRLEFKRSD